MGSALAMIALTLLHLQTQPGQALRRTSVPDSSEAPVQREPDLSAFLEGNEESAGYEVDLVAHTDYLREHPYDLNTVTLEELQSIPGILPTDASAVIDRRRSINRFTSVSQLLLLEEDGEGILLRLAPFVFVRPQSKGSDVVRARSRLRSDFREPTPERVDLGSPVSIYERLTICPFTTTSVGAVLEKESGERVADGIVSGYFELRDLPLNSQIVVGDYVVESGQGLLFWRNRYSSKGGNPAVSARRLPRGVRPFCSAAGEGYLRGIAVSFERLMSSGVNCSLFASRRSVDGTIDETGNLASVDENGLFRTEQELKKRNAAYERLIGGRAAWSMPGGIAAGISFFRSWFDRPMILDKITGETRRVFGAVGVDAMAGFGRLHFFGEAAWSVKSAFIIGTVVNISRRSNVVLLWRDYSTGYFNRHAGGFSEASETRNERGFYIGWNLAMDGQVTVTGWFDQYSSPAGTLSGVLPSGGRDIAIRIDAPLSRTITSSLRLSRRIAEVAESDSKRFDRATAILATRTLYRARVRLDLHPVRKVELTTQGEMRTVRQGGMKSGGGSLSQELRIRPTNSVSVSTKMVFFDSGASGSPLYQVEADVPGTYSNPALSGSGRRCCIVAQWRMVSWFELSLKYATAVSVTRGMVLVR